MYYYRMSSETIDDKITQIDSWMYNLHVLGVVWYEFDISSDIIDDIVIKLKNKNKYTTIKKIKDNQILVGW